MKKIKTIVNNDKERDKKCSLGATILVTGVFMFVLSSGWTEKDIYSKITFLVLGVLMIAIGAGLYVLGASVTDKKIQQDINIYIGKQLFEKGIYAFIVGVILGIFSILTK